MLPKKFVRAALWAETHTILKKLRFKTDKSLAALMHEAVLALEQAQQAETDAEAPRRLSATQRRFSVGTATPQPTTAA